MDCSSTLGFPVLYCLPEFAQIHVHRVGGDAIQPSHPLPPSPISPENFKVMTVFSVHTICALRGSFLRMVSPKPSITRSGAALGPLTALGPTGALPRGHTSQGRSRDRRWVGQGRPAPRDSRAQTGGQRPLWLCRPFLDHVASGTFPSS